MSKWLYHSMVFWLVGCQKPFTKPICPTDLTTVVYPALQLQFTSAHQGWSASLLSFVQPIPLAVQYTKNGFTVSAVRPGGVIEGPAQVCLSAGEQRFFYPVNLVNAAHTAFAQKEYRSPQTVNCDSGLQQQRMVHAIDTYRNLVCGNAPTDCFSEEMITLAPRAGTYRAMANDPLSAYYVQPGSCVNIPLKARYSREKNGFEVTAGPLYDRYQNTVADGSWVVFSYTDEVDTYRIEVALLNGSATAFVPATNGRPWLLKATINETSSATIQLNN